MIDRAKNWFVFGGVVATLAASGCARFRRQNVTPDSVVECRQLSREGVAALERGDAGRARELLDKAVAASPGDLDARRELAEVLWGEGAVPEALQHMEAAVRLDPHHAPTVVRAGEMLLAAGAIDGAAQRAADAVALDSTLAGAWALRGRVARQRGQFDSALADLQQALRFDPHDSGALIESAELQYQLGRPQRCLTTLHCLLDAYPQTERPRRALWLEGLAYGAVDRKADAVESLLAARDRGAPDADLLYQLARAQSEVGQATAATDSVRQAIALDGGTEPARALLAQLEGAGVPGVDTPLRR